MIELARHAGGVIVRDGLRQTRRVQPQLASQFFDSIGLGAGKNRRHKVTDRFAVDN